MEDKFNEVLKEKLNEYFSVCQQTKEQALNSISLFIYSLDAQKNDLFMLAKILPPKYLGDLISYYDGATLKMPTKEDYKYSKILAACFYLKEVEEWSWNKIRQFLKLSDEEMEEISGVAFGKKIQAIKDKFKPDFIKILMNKDLYDMGFSIQNFLKGTENDKEC